MSLDILCWANLPSQQPWDTWDSLADEDDDDDDDGDDDADDDADDDDDDDDDDDADDDDDDDGGSGGAGGDDDQTMFNHCKKKKKKQFQVPCHLGRWLKFPQKLPSSRGSLSFPAWRSGRSSSTRLRR